MAGIKRARNAQTHQCIAKQGGRKLITLAPLTDKKSVRAAWEKDLIDGVTRTLYKPDDTLTVAQAIKLSAALHQMLNNNGKVTLRNGSPYWYSSYVSYAVDNGIIEKMYLDYTPAQMNAPVKRNEFVHISMAR